MKPSISGKRSGDFTPLTPFVFIIHNASLALERVWLPGLATLHPNVQQLEGTTGGTPIYCVSWDGVERLLMV
jgi:hypothetical protein